MVVNAKVSLRQRRTKLDDLLTYDGPLADSEQEEFVALMESEAVTHCQRWQTVMAVLSLTLGTLMVIAGARQHQHPWDLKHHAFFNGAVSGTYVALGELLSGASYILTACLFLIPVAMSHGSSAGLSQMGRSKKSALSLPRLAVAFGALTGLLWAHAIVEALKVHGLPGNSALIYSWLPLGPPAYALLACQVAAMLRSTLEDAQKLRHQMYNLKSV